MTYKMKGFGGFKNHPVTPPTKEQSAKDKGKDIDVFKGEEAYKNAPSTFSSADIAIRRKNYKGNKQKIKNFFGM
tara:strand:+ start:850 stop:1071 length:222 start_codon:yes stop_codon:yes gene_type:complete